jgi:hypothetical protein
LTDTLLTLALFRCVFQRVQFLAPVHCHGIKPDRIEAAGMVCLTMSEVGGKTLTIGEFFREPFFVVVSVFV